MPRFVVLAACLALISTPAAAKVRFESYEGLDAIQQGRGGTKTVKNGLDWWTNGAPPRRYKVLGVLTDTRGAGKLAGDAIGAKSVAKAILEAGGNAAIVLGRDTATTGSIVNPEPNGGFTNIMIRRASTRLIAVQYLPD